MAFRVPRLFLPHSLRWQFALALSALVLLVFAAGLLAIHALRDAAETTHQLAGERLLRMETAQELERQTLRVGSEVERMWLATTPDAMHASHAEIIGRLQGLDELVDALAAASDDEAILELHQSAQVFRNSIHVAAGLREGALGGRGLTGEAERQAQRFYDGLHRQAMAMVTAAQAVSRRHTEDYRAAVEQLAQTAQRDQGRVLALLVGSLVLAWLVSHFFLGQRIIDRLREVSRHLRQGDAGDGAARVPVQGSDEIAEMARSVEQFLDDRRRLAEVNQALKAERERQEELIGKLAQAQTQLLQSEKLAAIGQLAAGVAHEINNPVGYVSSNLGTLKRYLDDLLDAIAGYEAHEQDMPEKCRAALAGLKQRVDLAFLREDATALIDESTKGLQRVTAIVQDLMEFSHLDETRKQLANLERGLDSTVNVVWNQIKDKAEVVKEYGGIPEVECIAPQINHVFMNLLVNAAQAIEGHGTITLRTTQSDDRVHIDIADTGCGIRPEHLKRIFDPFFTTRPVGKGTGLGLSLAYGIVQKHGGTIEVNSEPGVGTTFRITLPIRAVATSRGSSA